MKKFNKAWHQANVMPKNATLEQRIDWHRAHLKNCGCRPAPPNIMKLMTERKPEAKPKSD